MSMGRTIDSAVLEKGLRELNSDFSFDMANRLSEWRPVLSVGFAKWNPTRQGVYHLGRHICSMDRGLVPEFPQFKVVERRLPAGSDEADKDGVSTSYQVIRSTDLAYSDAVLHCMNRDPGWYARPDGAVIHEEWWKTVLAEGPKEMLGWRPTLLKIHRRQIPGVTIQSLNAKFGIDMTIMPIGTPQQIYRVLIEE
jgi:hypothetical protein